MEIKTLHKSPDIEQHKKLNKIFADFEKLINELKKREIPSEIIDSINQDIDEINSFPGSNKELLKLLRNTQFNVLKLIKKDLKLVPKNHYRNMWMAIGMAAFGIPFGVAFGVSLGNMAFIAIGIPIGMAVGIGVGTAMDKKAVENGKQLDLEIK
jgi:hypothetical protein